MNVRLCIALVASLALAALAGCPHLASGDGPGHGDGGGAGHDLAGGGDASAGDLATSSDLAPRGDGPATSGDLAQTSTMDLAQAPSDLTSTGSLDPGLALPSASGAPCTMPGSLTECVGIDVCRFFTPAQGRCESCTSCNNLGAACTASADCDILFMCYLGKCTNFCTLGTTECGPPANCLNIGHPTRGVCK